jgi:ElaB/YqjD/DUF883 family membrane-anchored ribosome-binding protein
MNLQSLIAILALLGAFFSIGLTICKTRKLKNDVIENFKHQLIIRINIKLQSIKPIRVDVKNIIDNNKLESINNKNSQLFKHTQSLNQRLNDIFDNLNNILEQLSDKKNPDMKNLRKIEIELISIKKKMEPLNDDLYKVQKLKNSFTI